MAKYNKSPSSDTHTLHTSPVSTGSVWLSPGRKRTREESERRVSPEVEVFVIVDVVFGQCTSKRARDKVSEMIMYSTSPRPTL
jgi:hypothetical protein